jgi:hypothetical protein
MWHFGHRRCMWLLGYAWVNILLDHPWVKKKGAIQWSSWYTPRICPSTSAYPHLGLVDQIWKSFWNCTCHLDEKTLYIYIYIYIYMHIYQNTSSFCLLILLWQEAYVGGGFRPNLPKGIECPGLFRTEGNSETRLFYCLKYECHGQTRDGSSIWELSFLNVARGEH